MDKKKRILYPNILSRGAEHDSTAFKNSKLCKDYLLPKWLELYEKGFYFIGDSAYAIKSFVLPPYPNVLHGSEEDNFNFFHSSARIAVECAFGEIELRWGIFWRPLQFSLEHNCRVIDACMKLHNFLVDFRETMRGEDEDMELFDEECRQFLAFHPDLNLYLYIPTTSAHPPGVIAGLVFGNVLRIYHSYAPTSRTLQTVFACISTASEPVTTRLRRSCPYSPKLSTMPLPI